MYTLHDLEQINALLALQPATFEAGRVQIQELKKLVRIDHPELDTLKNLISVIERSNLTLRDNTAEDVRVAEKNLNRATRKFSVVQDEYDGANKVGGVSDELRKRHEATRAEASAASDIYHRTADAHHEASDHRERSLELFRNYL